MLAARAQGVPSWRIILVHILPNAIGPIIVFFVQQIPYVIFTAAGFSFLGLGIQDPQADWGKMINDSVHATSRSTPLLVLVPIGCIGLACLSFSFLGDGLRDALDPDLAVGVMTAPNLSVGATPAAPAAGDLGPPLLEVRDLSVSFRLERSTIYAVQGLSLDVRAGERVGRGRRERVGEERLRDVGDADGAVAGEDHRWPDHLRGPGPPPAVARRPCGTSAGARSA